MSKQTKDIIIKAVVIVILMAFIFPMILPLLSYGR